MGTPKESLPFGHSTLLGHNAEVLLACTAPVVVVGRGGDQQLPPLPAGTSVVHDAAPGAGPLAAMATGMRHLLGTGGMAPGDAVMVTSCDLVYLTAAAVRWLAEQLGDRQAVMAQVDGVLQPLCAVYRLEVVTAAETLLGAGIRSQRALTEVVRCRILSAGEVAAFDPELRFLKGVNTPEDWRQVRP
jgi:molybdopterin-guanine dinucleotide biosynthesis protein A